MADKKKIKLTLAKGIARTRQDHRDTVRGKQVGHRALAAADTAGEPDDEGHRAQSPRVASA